VSQRSRSDLHLAHHYPLTTFRAARAGAWNRSRRYEFHRPVHITTWVRRLRINLLLFSRHGTDTSRTRSFVFPSSSTRYPISAKRAGLLMLPRESLDRLRLQKWTQKQRVHFLIQVLYRAVPCRAVSPSALLLVMFVKRPPNVHFQRRCEHASKKALHSYMPPQRANPLRPRRKGGKKRRVKKSKSRANPSTSSQRWS